MSDIGIAELGITLEEIDTKNNSPYASATTLQATEQYHDTSQPLTHPEKPTNIALIEELTKNKGIIPYSKFMEIALFGPDGYYSSGKAKIGEVGEEGTGDFMTSPEASGLFGASLGQAAKKVWETMGKPNTFRIIEMGAGRGTLADTMLYWLERTEPEFYKTIKYTILEYGDLIKKQQAKIRNPEKVEWVQGSAFTMPFSNVEGVLVSNELPDAFPVERVVRRDGEIRQVYVTLKEKTEEETEDRWVEVLGEPSEEVKSYIEQYGVEIQEAVEEPINLNAAKFQTEVDRALKKGAIITIDYGDDGPVGVRDNHTLRIYSEEIAAETDPAVAYTRAGDVDITASVNFAVLKQIAAADGLSIDFDTSQFIFLEANGLGDPRKMLADVVSNIKSFSELLSIRDDLKHMDELFLSDGSGGFFTLVTTKGITPLRFEQTAHRDPEQSIMPSVRLKIGKPNERLLLQNAGSGYATTDNDGYLDIRISLLDPSNRIAFRAYLENGDAIFDSHNKDQMKEVIENSGYVYDLED